MNKSRNYTHQVAVIGYTIDEGKILLLKRETPPRVWAPPGGRLFPDEDPGEGLLREIREETSLIAEIVTPVDIWFGKWRNSYLLSIDYLVRVRAGEIRLSKEHSQYRWLTLDELIAKKEVFTQPESGFTLQDFEKAFRYYRHFQK